MSESLNRLVEKYRPSFGKYTYLGVRVDGLTLDEARAGLLHQCDETEMSLNANRQHAELVKLIDRGCYPNDPPSSDRNPAATVKKFSGWWLLIFVGLLVAACVNPFGFAGSAFLWYVMVSLAAVIAVFALNLIFGWSAK